MIHLHIISQTGGSIGEITNSLIPYFKNHFKVTEEFKYEKPEIPQKLDILLMHFINPNYIKSRVFDYFKLKILIQPIDGTSIKEEYINLIDKFDFIICPSKSNKKILLSNGIENKKLVVIPNFIKKDDIFIKKQNNKKFKFYTEMYYQKRKNLNAIIDIFKSTFDKENVELVIKSNLNKNEFSSFKKDIKTNYNSKSKIKFINGYLEKDKLKSLWETVDCYINLSGIEGFGIPLLRFELNNIPIIAINNKDSGYLDFINKKYLINKFIYKKDKDLQIYKDNSLFAVPDKKETMSTLKRVFYDSRKFDFNLNLDILFNYNIKNIKEQYIKFLITEFKNKNKEVNNLKIEHNLKIKYTSPYGTSGYSIAANQYMDSLLNKSEIQWNPLYFDKIYNIKNNTNITKFKDNFDYNINILHSTPEWWPNLIDKDKLNVGYTVWETDKLHPDWINYINTVDIIFVPTYWNKKIFENSGITKPIYVIPHISLDTINNKIHNNKIRKFYTIGQWTERKGTEDTIRSYLETFNDSDDTVLTVKTFLNNYSIEEINLCKEKIKNIINEYSNPAKIKLIPYELTDKEILNLHIENDCYISACKAEGWGLGAFEAAYFNNPVIITGFGGQTEFLNNHKEWLINYKKIKVSGMSHIPWYEPTQNWAEPNLNDLKFKLKKIYKSTNIKCNYNIFENFNKNLISNKIIKAINENL